MNHLITILAIFSLVSCQNTQNEQNLTQLDKKSAREVTLKTVTVGDSVLHITTQNIWYNGEQIVSKHDTIVTASVPTTWNSQDSLTTMNQIPIYVTVQ